MGSAENKQASKLPETGLTPLSELVLGTYKQRNGDETVVTAQQVIDRDKLFQIIGVLGEMPIFSTDSALTDFVKAVPDLSPWKYKIPFADTISDRITYLIGFLQRQNRTDGRNALEIFVRNLPTPETDTK